MPGRAAGTGPGVGHMGGDTCAEACMYLGTPTHIGPGLGTGKFGTCREYGDGINAGSRAEGSAVSQ